MEQMHAKCRARLRLHLSPAKGLQIIHGPAKISSFPTVPCPLASERKPGSGGLGLCSQIQSRLTSCHCPCLCSGHFPRQGLWGSAAHGDQSQDTSPCATAALWQQMQGGSVPLGPWGWGHDLAMAAGCPQMGREDGAARWAPLGAVAVLGHPRAAEAVAPARCANQK